MRSLHAEVPPEHIAFLNRTGDYYETEDFIFIHAGYEPESPMESQPALALRWRAARRDGLRPHISGKTAIVGHTAQRSGEILDLGFLKCIDTNCVRGGWLTALDATSGKQWRCCKFGRLCGSH